ncbi:4Fe-4S dicluster domain-containing protein [Roseomonas hellenica]|uniref:4Fe-4S dicluster domain-containing protein n=2 Tax=Plastoroseomonas hellenica TaxID=2687306 RepID=A0ABS5F2G8_9PROT|nr:4Fe-4S dicluster domain-containing protein [Plastoroseomonas hellenica]
MAEARTVFVCSCEDTMPLDAGAIARGCGGALRTAEQLCLGQMERFTAALAEGRPITVACTAQAPLFREAAEDAGSDLPLIFANVREHAGWSRDAKRAGPKMAAILAAAAEPMPTVPLTPLTSEGVALILGRDAAALDLAETLKDRLDLTVLLTGAEPVPPRPTTEYPVLRGRVRTATGWLGNFDLAVDGYAMPRPSSRDAYAWGPARDGARSRCDIVIDISGEAPLFHETRQGYLRADPGDAAAAARIAREAGELVGSFDKPRFIAFEAGLCAHSRNRRTGCTRCLDLCPTGAITPGKDSVAISAEICAGCGACAAVCPTGAAQYALPPSDAMAGRIRRMLLAYTEAGGRDAVLLLHDAAQGEPLLDALARHGDGLPATVLPLRVNEVTAVDLGLIVGALAWGAGAVRLLLPAKRPHGSDGLFRTIDYAAAALGGLGLEQPVPRVAAIETDDPFTLGETLSALPRMGYAHAPESFLPMGAPREILRAGLSALHRASGGTATTVPMPAQAPFGVARVAADGCTLCLACTSVCPTGAFSANPEAPQLRFLEDACVQCGLCAATCPEKVITLEPRLNFTPEARQPVVVKEEAPFHCLRCQKPFGTASSIAKVKAKLAAHWMFADPARLRVLEMCEDCRVIEATEGGIDPYAGPTRPTAKTTEDWQREAERAKRSDA